MGLFIYYYFFVCYFPHIKDSNSFSSLLFRWILRFNTTLMTLNIHSPYISKTFTKTSVANFDAKNKYLPKLIGEQRFLLNSVRLFSAVRHIVLYSPWQTNVVSDHCFYVFPPFQNAHKCSIDFFYEIHKNEHFGFNSFKIFHNLTLVNFPSSSETVRRAVLPRLFRGVRSWLSIHDIWKRWPLKVYWKY